MERFAVVGVSPGTVSFVVSWCCGDGGFVMSECVVVTDSFGVVWEGVWVRDGSVVVIDTFVIDAFVRDDDCVLVGDAVDTVRIVVVVMGDDDDISIIGVERFVVWVICVCGSGRCWPTAREDTVSAGVSVNGWAGRCGEFGCGVPVPGDRQVGVVDSHAVVIGVGDSKVIRRVGMIECG